MKKHKKSHHSAPKRKKKSLMIFYLVALVSIAIGVPVAYKLSSMSAPSGSVEGITSASGSGELKISGQPCPPGAPCAAQITKGATPPKPPVYLSTETLSRQSCFPEFQKIEYTCSDGYTGTYDTTQCVSMQTLLKNAEGTCMKRGITGTPPPGMGDFGNRPTMMPPAKVSGVPTVTTKR